MPIKKSIHNPCPICGLPRGKGKYEFAHGKCLEIRLVTEGKRPAFDKHFREGKPITVEQSEKSIRHSTAKRYKDGKLPPWMFD